MKNYADFYAKITDPIRKNPGAVHSLILINRLLTAIMYLVYPLLLVYLFFKQQNQMRIVVIDTNNIDFVNNEEDLKKIENSIFDNEYPVGITRIIL